MSEIVQEIRWPAAVDIGFVETVGGDLTIKVENNTETGEGISREHRHHTVRVPPAMGAGKQARRQAAPSMASQMACNNTSASLWPMAPL